MQHFPLKKIKHRLLLIFCCDFKYLNIIGNNVDGKKKKIEICNGIFIITIIKYLFHLTLNIRRANLFGFYVRSDTNITRTLQNFM